MLKPMNQLQLSEQELKEEFTKILTSENPRASSDEIRFDYKEMKFTKEIVNNTVTHFFIKGFKVPIEYEQAKKESVESSSNADSDSQTSVVNKIQNESEEGTQTKIKINNQFHFIERATQTYNRQNKDKTIMTEPPPLSEFSGEVNQWTIFDAYQRDFENMTKSKKFSTPGDNIENVEEDENLNMENKIKIIERMVNQNIFNDIILDFKYFEDTGEENGNKGSILPLWTFHCKKVFKKYITDVCWNKTYKDLFAVSFGQYNEGIANGLIFYFSLKNPSHPELVLKLETCVLSIDIHKTHPNLLVAGLHDGNIFIYDVAFSITPVLTSGPLTKKHEDLVWDVKWIEEDKSFLELISVSRDGSVLLWSIIKNDLSCRKIMDLHLDIKIPPTSLEILASYPIKASATCVDLNPFTNKYLVGSEEGNIYYCSTKQIIKPFETLKAHTSPVLRVMWNPMHQNVLISCGHDSTVKIWDIDFPQRPMLLFDLENPVQDVAWSLHSSTVFIALTKNGKILVFDLQANLFSPIFCQGLPQNKTLHRIAFNPLYPIIITVNNAGSVQAWKLSASLRKVPKEKKSQSQNKEGDKERNRQQYEFEKLEKILKSWR